MTKIEKQILDAEIKYRIAKEKRIADEEKQKELDERLKNLESEAAKAMIEINKKKTK